MTERTRTFSWQDPQIVAAAGRTRSGMELLAAMRDGELPRPPIMDALDYQMVELAAGRVVFSLVPAEFHYNPLGVVHGGVVTTLLDTVMGCAVHSMLPAGTGYTTLELKVNFVRGLTVDSGPVTAEGTVVHLGNRVATSEARLTGRNGKLYAHATSTCLLLSPTAPASR